MYPLAHILRLATALAILSALAAAATPTVAAQEEITFRIAKFDCEADPGDVNLLEGPRPEDCSPIAGVSFEVTDENGDSLGSCTTGDDGMCRLEVPNAATVTVTEDESTGTAGFSPRENPITTQAVTEFAGAIFVNLPDPKELPDTGVGTAAPADQTPVWIALGCGIVCSLAAIAVRRRAA